MRADPRPSFATDFPRDLELDALVDSFVQGNYARVRADARRILASDADEGIKRAARQLVERTRPDPLALLLLGLTALLLAAVGGWWTMYGRAPAPPPPHAAPARTPSQAPAPATR
jgi:hypothetical protein